MKFRNAPQIVGIIGSDLFKQFVVEIDYLAKTLVLFEPKNYKAHGEILPMEILEEIDSHPDPLARRLSDRRLYDG